MDTSSNQGAGPGARAQAGDARSGDGLEGRGRLTIVIPAFNEALRIAGTIEEVDRVARAAVSDYEIIVVDDGSHDGTFDAAIRQAACNPSHVRVARQSRNLGVGAAYALGLREAQFPYLSLVPGDRAFTADSLARVFRQVGCTELIVSFRTNPRERAPLRRALSVLATVVVRAISGHRIRDAHSLFVFPVGLARCIPVSAGYSYHLETLCHLLRRVDGFRQVGVELTARPDSSSSVMRPGTILALALSALRMAWLRLTGRLDG